MSQSTDNLAAAITALSTSVDNAVAAIENGTGGGVDALAQQTADTLSGLKDKLNTALNQPTS